MRQHAFPAAAAWCALAAAAAGQLTVNVRFDVTEGELTPTERSDLAAHIDQAGRDWFELMEVDGPRSIEVLLRVDNSIPRATGASATSSFVGVVGGRNLFEQGAAAEVRTGVDPNGAAPDVIFSLNLVYLRDELWFDPDPAARAAAVPADRTDAFSVWLHEFGHAWAYNGWADGLGVPPETFWSPWDRSMRAGSPGGPLPVQTGPSMVEAWGGEPDITVGNINHWANPADALLAVEAREQAPSRRGILAWDSSRGTAAPRPTVACLTPPSADRPGGSRAATGDPALIGQLMNGVVFFRGERYFLSALDRAVLADVGIPLRDLCPADVNGDGSLTFADVTAFIQAFNSGGDAADINGDGILNFGDVSAFIAVFNAGCP